MANPKRGKLVSIIWRGNLGSYTYPPKELQGLTPEQHCQKQYSQTGEGYFEKKNVGEDVCMLKTGGYFSETRDKYLPVWSYYYEVIEDIVLTPQTVATVPANRKRTTIGVGEAIDILSDIPVYWDMSSDLVVPNKVKTTALSKSIRLTALGKSGSVVIKAKTKYKEASITIKIIEPTGVKYELDYKDDKPRIYHPKGGYELVVGLRIIVQPVTVNFDGIVFQELDSAAVCSGVFNDGKVHCHLADGGKGKEPGKQCNGEGTIFPVISTGFLLNRVKGFDMVGGGENDPNKIKNLPASSAMKLNIGIRWKLSKNTATWKKFSQPVKQAVILYKSGNITVSKGNYSKTLTINDSYPDKNVLW
ncbi:hypothetical protein [Stenoxybacter acetivorans]|uniref:hypothetical protein n=1 Tax=Stenoxybacter acetivorans TaxID=422441 RepID=UPI0005684E92|nr:hypothetical protein [Stenoxybacter acetivorans]